MFKITFAYVISFKKNPSHNLSITRHLPSKPSTLKLNHHDPHRTPHPGRADRAANYRVVRPARAGGKINLSHPLALIITLSNNLIVPEERGKELPTMSSKNETREITAEVIIAAIEETVITGDSTLYISGDADNRGAERVEIFESEFNAFSNGHSTMVRYLGEWEDDAFMPSESLINEWLEEIGLR